jgi:hypothetical protein
MSADSLKLESGRPLRRAARNLGIAAAAFLLCVLAPLYVLYVDWPASATAVPGEIKKAGGGKNGATGTAYVYDFWGNFIDSEHLWKVEVSAECLARFVDEYRLSESPSEVGLPRQFWSQPPYWWDPPKSGRLQFFRSGKFDPINRGQDGIHFLLLYDEEAGVLYAWVKYNF